MKKLIEAIHSGQTFLICTHIDPDGDTIGSASALASILNSLGKQTVIYSKGPVPEIYKFLKHTDEFVAEVDAGSRFDAVIAVDCGDAKRIADWDKIRSLSGTIINIDHHADNKRFGEINYVKDCSATGELIYNLAKRLKIDVDADMATSIYSAIVTDTGCFKYDNTSAKVFEIVSDLLKCGANPHDIAFRIYESKTRSELKILGTALENIETSPDGKVAWVCLSMKDVEKTGAKKEELHPIVDYIRALKGVEMAVFLREVENGMIKINFRSKTTSARRIAQEFGGGGHLRASGAVVKGDLEAVKCRVLETITNLWTEL